ncbi:hypothetical protein [Pectobacterium cacticida]|uniref:hypothetical protein n=1 Tax=Pectobacterium cacticida TaxID=69221 RepID=UPI003A8FCF02
MNFQPTIRSLPRPATLVIGDSPELADELLQLVLEGHKTATCNHAFKNEETPQSAIATSLALLRDVAVKHKGRLSEDFQKELSSLK